MRVLTGLRVAIILAIVLLLVPGCPRTKEVPLPDISYGELVVNGTRLTFGITLPQGYTPGQPVPLVLALHYGGSGEYYGKAFALNLVEPALRDLSAIVISPDCPGSGWANAASENLVMALIAHIVSKYTIDNRRILVTGYSLGAIGSWYMAARQPQVFTAAIPISGSAMPGAEDLLGKIRCPVYVIHSRNDEIFPVAAIETLVEKLRGWGIDIHLEIISGLSHYQTTGFVPFLRAAIPWIRQVWGE